MPVSGELGRRMSKQLDSAASPGADANANAILRFFRALGPAVIVASVVLGPGSILSSSKVGAAYGFSMVWVLFPFATPGISAPPCISPEWLLSEAASES